MAKNKSSNQPANIPQDEPTLSDESLEQVAGGTGGGQSHNKGKGKKANSSLGGGGGNLTSITDGTSNTIAFGEK